jgi:hypothetical protein
MDDLMLPKQPVNLNATWKIDPEGLAKLFEKAAQNAITLDRAKSAATGKLLRAYKKDGHQFGVVEFSMNLPVGGTMKLGDALKANVAPGSKLTVKGTADGCIDGSQDTVKSNMQMAFHVTATFTGPDGKEYKLAINTTNTEKGTSTDLVRK